MGEAEPNPAGGQGGQVSVAADPHRIESDAIMVRMALRRGWDVPDAAKKVLPARFAEAASQALEVGNIDAAVKCGDLVRRFEADNVTKFVAVDKADRLDQDKPTENYTHRQSTITVEESTDA